MVSKVFLVSKIVLTLVLTLVLVLINLNHFKKTKQNRSCVSSSSKNNEDLIMGSETQRLIYFIITLDWMI